MNNQEFLNKLEKQQSELLEALKTAKGVNKKRITKKLFDILDGKITCKKHKEID